MPRRKPGAARSAVPTPIWVLLAVLCGLALYRFVAGDEAAAQHPEPRAGVSAAAVLPGTRYPSHPSIAAVYEEARRIPGVIDGLYCHCGCSEHSGHRSLLSCFESDHGAGCDVCLGEADTAYRMHGEGASLEAIRAAIDAAFAR